MKRNIILFFKSIIVVLTFTLALPSYSQHTDSLQAVRGISQDTFYIIRENIPESKFWGNKWHAMISYTRSKQNEFEISGGRTFGKIFCSGGGCMYTVNSWGLGYGRAWRNGPHINLAKAYYEHTFFYFPPISWALRMEYMYDFTNHKNYLRPAVGLSFIRLDLLYNYSLPLQKGENLFKHGFTVRFKLFTRFNDRESWQYNHPNRC